MEPSTSPSDPLRVPAALLLPIGAIGSLGLLVYAGRHNSSHSLLLLFALWILLPFAILSWARWASRRWSAITQSMLHLVTIVLTVGSLALYALVVLGPPRPQIAFVFLVVPPASCAMIALFVPYAALLNRRRPQPKNPPGSSPTI